VLPQLGIFAQGTAAHQFLEFDLRPGIRPAEAVEAFRGLRAPHVSAGGVNLVVGFCSRMWREMAPADHVPFDLREFRPIDGVDGRGAPATQHDAWIWVSGAAPDIAWDHAGAATEAVAGVATLVADQPAFTYRDGRDMTGFIDGTENPPSRLAPSIAMVPPERAGAGGSHVLVMRWVHDLDTFARLAASDQERVIGRTKPDSVELEPPSRPPTAHISRVQVDDQHGEEIEIYRRSVPYGTVRLRGLYFLAFSAERARFETLLARMFGTSDDGVTDRLTDFSRPVTGAYYFAPSLNALADVGGRE
jgi:porphyrinogen peroxidase